MINPVSVQFYPSTRTSKKFMAVFTLDNDHKIKSVDKIYY